MHRRQTLSRQATRGLVGGGVVAASVSAGVSVMASAGGFASASAGMAARAAMVPRGVYGLHKTVKALEMAAGVAVVTVSLVDAVSSLATRASTTPATTQDERRQV